MIQDFEKEHKSFSISELHFEDEMKLKCSSCFKTILLNSLINKEGRQLWTLNIVIFLQIKIAANFFSPF